MEHLTSFQEVTNLSLDYFLKAMIVDMQMTWMNTMGAYKFML